MGSCGVCDCAGSIATGAGIAAGIAIDSGSETVTAEGSEYLGAMVESIGSWSTVAVGIAVDPRSGTGAIAVSDCPNSAVVLGVSALADVGLPRTVKAASPNRKEADLKHIFFTVTPQT